MQDTSSNGHIFLNLTCNIKNDKILEGANYS